MDNLWEFATVFLACCLVAGITGWYMAGRRYMDLAARVSSMEAAVAAYWDRVRKRMSIETPRQLTKTPFEMSEEEIIQAARNSGLLDVPTRER